MDVNIYKNGVLTNSEASTLKDPTFSVGPMPKKVRNNSYLAKSNWTGNGYFKGAIDEFRVYDRIISENEITCLSEKYGCKSIL